MIPWRTPSRESAMPAATPAPRGIYLLANDRRLDDAIALISSVRAWDAEIPIVVIPHAAPYRGALATLTQLPGVTAWQDERWLARLDRRLAGLFGKGFFRQPANLHKLACWFGPFDRFLYLDADIVVFERIAGIMDHLEDRDFVCCDDQFEGGLKHVFKPEIRAAGVLGDEALGEVFNGGLVASRRGVFTPERLDAHLTACARHKALLDRSSGGSDQPVLNWLILSQARRRLNLFRALPDEPRMWAGTPGFVADGDRLVDPVVGRSLRFLHWAGLRIAPGAPYWAVWEAYRCHGVGSAIPYPANPGAPR